MARTLFEHLSPDTGAKRVLALDGGGVKSILTLAMLKVLEAELRRRAGGAESFRLSDYYDLIGGTSTGAILASALALGLSVDELIALFETLAPDVYGKTAGDGVFLQAKFDAGKLKRALTPVLTTKTLGSEELKTGLAICAKRIDSGGAWVLSNHPLGAFYDPPAESANFPNKRYRLIDLVLASTGAPTLYDDVVIDIEFDEKRRSLKKGHFLDGAVGGANNPSLQMFMLALDPAYKFGWKAGAQSLMMTSCGAGLRRPQVPGPLYQGLPPGVRATHALRSLVYDTEMQAIMMMQAFSEPKLPWRINAEMGDQSGALLAGAALLDFQRMDVMLDTKPKPKSVRDPTPPMTPMERMLGRELDADAMEQLGLIGNGKKENMDLLFEIGTCAGKVFIEAGYPDAAFDLAEWRG